MTWNFILRLFVAGLLGGLIGLEREFRAKEAGVRTHFIVALGSALFMIISQYAFTGRFDAARVAAQVVSGIGFIGAGVIIFQKNVVRGITTAAGLWVAAAVGLASGAGMYDVAVAAAIMTILCLETMHFVNRKYGERSLEVRISSVDRALLGDILEKMKARGVEVDSFRLDEADAHLRIRVRNKDYAETARTLLEMTAGHCVEIS